MAKITDFPDENNRIKHIYNNRQCAGCKKEIDVDEIFHEIVLEIDQSTKEHIALCEKCYQIAIKHGTNFNN